MGKIQATGKILLPIAWLKIWGCLIAAADTGYQPGHHAGILTTTRSPECREDRVPASTLSRYTGLAGLPADPRR